MALFGPTPEKIEKWISKGSVGKLLKSLGTEDAIIKLMVVEGLAKLGNPEVLYYCKENATSENQEVRWQITKILGLIGTPEAMEILSMVEDPKDRMVRSFQKKKKS